MGDMGRRNNDKIAALGQYQNGERLKFKDLPMTGKDYDSLCRPNGEFSGDLSLRVGLKW